MTLVQISLNGKLEEEWVEFSNGEIVPAEQWVGTPVKYLGYFQEKYNAGPVHVTVDYFIYGFFSV